MHERDELRSKAAAYGQLRGLRFVPLGAILILAALANAGVGPFGNPWAFPVALLVLGAACLPLYRHYDEHYGRVSPSAAQQARALAALALAAAVMIGVSLLLRSRASWSLDLPVNPIAVAFALVMLISYASGGGLRAHQAAVAGALLLAGALPVWEGEDPGNAGLVLSGAAIAISGILDHRLLVRTFGPARPLDHGA